MKRGGGKKVNDVGAAITPEKAVDVICRSLKAECWVPSKALAKCLAVPYQRFLVVTTPKDNLSNLIWTSVLVLVYCATHLVDYHESWYEVANVCTAWLRTQQHFVDQREDLVQSACNLLNVGDPDQLLTTLFALIDATDPAIAAENAALLENGWQRCFLNEPPYTAYYWNAETDLSTWRHPLETAQMEREVQEKKDKRKALLAKVLPQRIPINRDVKPLAEVQVCSECALLGVKREASVLCLECGKRYFCESCCDIVHYDRTKRSHLATGLRFRECFGRAGFPKIVHRPRTPFMIYQDEQKKLEENKQLETNLLVIQN